ncbi:formin-like protein 20 [Amphibalanus amphitrite]|uniref:formin-like protein 20 n=1 Tax=Amphibalanus amphitrite TaxID=1232801 RepID=UPI001C901D61|nr:formin-like protein 20 [Amphibalanus amphitrite]
MTEAPDRFGSEDDSSTAASGRPVRRRLGGDHSGALATTDVQCSAPQNDAPRPRRATEPMNGIIVSLLVVVAAAPSVAEQPPDGSAVQPTDVSTIGPTDARRFRSPRDTNSLISQMAELGGFTETLSEARPVSITTDVTSSTADQSAKPSLFDTMPNRGASMFPVTISPVTLDDQYGPPSVPFAVADATYGTSSSSDQLVTLIQRYLSERTRSGAATSSAASGGTSATRAASSPAPSTLYQQPVSQSPVQAAPPVTTAQPITLSSSYGLPPRDPLPIYAAPLQVQTVTVTSVASPVTSYVVQPPAAAPVTVPAPAAAPAPSYTRPQAAPVVTYTYTVQPPAAAAPVQTYVSAPVQTTAVQQQQAVPQPSLVLPAPVGAYLLQSPAAATPVSQSYSTPLRNPLVTPQLTYITPYGIDSGRRQRDRERDQEDDSGVVISLGDASIQLGGRSGTSIRLNGGLSSERPRDSTGSGSSITIIAGGAAARDPPAPIGPLAPSRGYSTPRDPPRDPPSSYSAPLRDPPASYSAPLRDPPSSYSPPRDPPSSYTAPQRDPPASYSAPLRDPPSSYSPPRDPPSSYAPPRDPPSSYSSPRDPPTSYGGGRNSDQPGWNPISSDPPSASPASDDDVADDDDTYTSYEGQTRTFPSSDAPVGRTGIRDAVRDPPGPAPPPRTYGAPPRDPPSSMYGAPPARDPPSSTYGAPPARDPPSSSYGAPPARDPPSPPPRTYGAPPRDPPSPMYGAPPAQDPPAPAPMYGAPPADAPRDPPSSSYGAPARDPPAAAPPVPATPVQLVQAVPVAVFSPRPRPRPRKKPHHHHKGPPRGRLVKDTIIREVSRPVRPRAPPFPGRRPAATPQLFLATVPQNTQTFTLSSPVRNPPASPPSSYGAPRSPAADPPSPSYGAPQRSPGARSAPPVGVVRDTLVREVLYDQFKDDYAKLFYKGALLIGALALLPAAATVPLAAGRRRRSLFDAEVAAGAELPAELRRQLGAALPELAQLDTSECLQRELCRALRQVEASPYRDSFLLYYAVLSPDVGENPWMQQALTAARKRTCSDFYCQSAPSTPAANHTIADNPSPDHATYTNATAGRPSITNVSSAFNVTINSGYKSEANGTTVNMETGPFNDGRTDNWP